MITVQEIIDARTGATGLGSVKDQDRSDALDGLIKRAYAMKGYTVDVATQPEIDIAVRMLIDKIDRRWSYLTLGELWLALEAGVCGTFTKDTRPTIANYFAWIEAYTDLDVRKEAITELKARKEERERLARALPAESEEARLERVFTEHARKQWEHYKQHGTLNIVTNGFAAALYDFLAKKGKLRATTDTIRSARLRALKCSNSSQFTRFADNSDLDYETKRELLSMYFEHLKQRGAELRL